MVGIGDPILEANLPAWGLGLPGSVMHRRGREGWFVTSESLGRRRSNGVGRRILLHTGFVAALAGALLVTIAVLGMTAVVDRFASDAYEADIRAIVSSDADALARNLSDLVARETASVDALAAFVENGEGDDEYLRAEFPQFGDALLQLGQTIRSVQLGPDGILDYVHPLEGNEEALGLDLMADESRRALLEPAIASGATVIQGPVELVQGGLGLIVRRPIYIDGDFWGFSAAVLDWPSVAELTGLTPSDGFNVAGVKLAETGEVIAGSPDAFTGDPITRELEVGGTDTRWVLAERPIGGWPQRSAETPFIWAAGVFLAGMSGFLSFSLIRRPELLRRERERAVEELAALEARYQATFENAGVGIVIADTTGRPISANPEFREIVGLGDDDSLEGLDVLSMLGRDDRLAYVAGMERLFTGGSAFEMEVRLVSANVDRWCRVRTSLIRGATRRDALVIAIVEDSTERHTAEKALARSELRYRQLFELAPIAIQREDHTAVAEEVIALREAGVADIRAHARENPDWLKAVLARVPILDENPAAAQLQAQRGGARGPLTLLDRYTEEAEATFIESIAAIADGRSRIAQEVATRRADGSPLHLDLRWQAPIVGGTPDYSNVMVTLADVTELRETSRRLQEMMESKDRFLASVAHELRTPLTAVVGFAEELRDPGGLYSSREKAEFQELIAFHGAEMANIIEDLLVWARGDIGEVQVMPEPMDLARGVGQTLRLLPDVKLSVEKPDGAVIAMADPARVRQIVRNLVTNALRYGGDSITVCVCRVGDVAVVEVSDNGPEIPIEVRRRMFEPYQRANAETSQPGSIGLGLTVARTLARLQHGDLVCVREGSRNVFRLTLPLLDLPRSGESVGSLAGSSS